MKKTSILLAAALACSATMLAQNPFRNGSSLPQKQSIIKAEDNNDEDEPDPLEVYGIITDQPEGELKIYAREGQSWHVRGNRVVEDSQKDMTMQIVFASDGKTAYVQNPIAYVKAGTWVKGELNGNSIKVPAGIYLTYNYRYEAAQQLLVMKEDESTTDYLTYIADSDQQFIEYTVDGDNISLNLPSDKHILSAVWTDNGEWTGYGDFASSYSPFTLSSTTPPATSTQQLFTIEGTDYYHTLMTTATVATEGDNVYIKGLCDLIPEGWIKGTKQGSLVTFEKQQFVGLTLGSSVYLLGSDSGNNDNITDCTFYYDEDNGTYSMVTTYMVMNGNTTKFDDYDYYEQIILRPDGSPTSIATLSIHNQSAPAYYDLAGRRLAKPRQGVNIVAENGKTTLTIKTK